MEEIRKKAFSRLTSHPESHRSTVWSKMSLKSPKNSNQVIDSPSSYRENLGFDHPTFGNNSKPNINVEDDSLQI